MEESPFSSLTGVLAMFEFFILKLIAGLIGCAVLLVAGCRKLGGKK